MFILLFGLVRLFLWGVGHAPFTAWTGSRRRHATDVGRGGGGSVHRWIGLGRSLVFQMGVTFVHPLHDAAPDGGGFQLHRMRQDGFGQAQRWGEPSNVETC